MSATKPQDLHPEPAADALLSIRGLSKSFGPVHALVDVDLDLRSGAVTALCGDNGAGKSVLIKTISGLWAPEAGHIFWEGREVHLHSPRAAEDLGITTIYQDLALCDNLDVTQNMFLGHEPLHHGTMDESTMEIAARNTLSRLNVNLGSVRQVARSLSGGQRQTVAVARALLSEAKLVIMDEPTAALGVRQTAMVLDLISQLAANGVAVLVISHNLNDVFAVADDLAVLHLGHLVARGPAADYDRSKVVSYMSVGRLTSRERPAAPAAELAGHA